MHPPCKLTLYSLISGVVAGAVAGADDGPAELPLVWLLVGLSLLLAPTLSLEVLCAECLMFAWRGKTLLTTQLGNAEDVVQDSRREGNIFKNCGPGPESSS